jgi:hypothetical protein
MIVNHQQHPNNEQYEEPARTIDHVVGEGTHSNFGSEQTYGYGKMQQAQRRHDGTTTVSCSDDDSPIQAFLRTSARNHDSISSTLHTDTNITQDSSSAHATYSFDGGFFDDHGHLGIDCDEHGDDISITDEFFTDSTPDFEIVTNQHQAIIPTDLYNLDIDHSHADRSHGMDDGPFVGPTLFVQEEAGTVVATELEGSMSSLNAAFGNLNRCMERSSETRAIIQELSATRAIIQELSASSPILLPGSASSTLLKQAAPQPGLNFQHSSSSSNLMVSSHGSLGGTTRRHDSNGSLPRAGSISEMKRSGIAPRKAANSAFSHGPKKPKILSLATRNRLLRDLYSASAKSKSPNQKKQDKI